ncbi:jg392, partial [Pararge aegeria aegeria]
MRRSEEELVTDIVSREAEVAMGGAHSSDFGVPRCWS